MALAYHRNTRVTFLRWVLPVLAIITVVLAAAWPTLKDMQINALSRNSATRLKVEDIAATMPQAGSGKPLQLEVSKPEYSGLDDEGHPYVITATRVIQDGLQPGKSAMNLDQPTAQLTLDKDGSEKVSLKAATGFFDPKQRTLQLSGPVQVTHTQGYVLDMQDFFVNFTDGSGVTQHPVTGSGPDSTLSGQELHMLDKGNHIILKGRSKITLVPKENG